MWAAARRILQINNILQVQVDANSSLISICCERNGRSFQFGFGKTECAEPWCGNKHCGNNTKTYSLYALFSSSCILYPKKTVGLWEMQKELLQNYCKIAQIRKKKRHFLFSYYFLSLSLVSTFFKSNLFSHLKSQIFHSQLFLHILWLSRNKI